MKKSIAGTEVEVNDDGYLMDVAQWNEEVAKDLAKELGIELTDRHWDVLRYLRKEQEAGNAITIRKVGSSDVVDIKEFYQLFPGGPLKNASKIAGLQKPESCM